MDTIDRAIIEKRIDELKKERDQYIATANMQIAAFNGAISALEQLVAVQEDKK